METDHNVQILCIHQDCRTAGLNITLKNSLNHPEMNIMEED